MKIILIAGKAGSGKSEVANILKEKLKKSIVTSLSKYIKIFAMEETSWNGQDETKPRQYLQETGDALRNIDINFLPKRILEDIEYYKKNYNYVIINDVRLINEVEFFKKSQYETLSIYINGQNTKKLTESEKAHITETELEDYNNFDYIINNDYNQNIVEKIEKIVEENRL